MKKQIYLATALIAIMMSSLTLINAQQNWLLNGNSLAPNQFLGSTNHASVLFKMNNAERMRIDTNGMIGIGTMAPSSPLDILNTTKAKTLNIRHNLNTGNTNYANYTSATNNGIGPTYAYYGTVTGTGSGTRYGFYTQLTGNGSGNQIGSYSQINNTSNGEHTGYYATLTGPGTGKQYGARISISNTGSGTHYGVYSVLTGTNAVTKYGIYSSATGGTNNYAFYGLGRSYFSDNVGIGVTQPSSKLHVSTSTEAKAVSIKNEYTGAATKHGIFNEVTSAGSAGRYGIYNSVSSPSTAAAASYGIYTKLESGSGIAWGILSEGSNNSNEDAYGIYATASSTGSNNKRYGVRGFASSNTSNQVSSYGVYGSASGGSALASNVGVYGTASGGSSNIGVYGTASDGWAGYFEGISFTEELRVGSDPQEMANGYIVSVDGKIICEELRVQSREDWPDYVFEDSYQLPSLEEVEQHIKDKKHLPGIPSACEVEENGLLIGEMQKMMMEKIEELTLYLIEMKKENTQIRAELDLLKSSK